MGAISEKSQTEMVQRKFALMTEEELERYERQYGNAGHYVSVLIAEIRKRDKVIERMWRNRQTRKT